MSEVARADLPFIGQPEFDLLLRKGQAWLSARGEMVVGSGPFTAGDTSPSCPPGPRAQPRLWDRGQWIPRALTELPSRRSTRTWRSSS